MKLTGRGVIKTRLAASVAVSGKITGSATLRTLSPDSGPPCPPITVIDGGEAGTIYDPIYGTIDGGGA